MSEILNVLDVNDYGLQSMKASGGGGEVNLQSKEVTITENGTTTVRPDTGYDGLSDVGVTVNVPSVSRVALPSTSWLLIGSSYKGLISNLDWLENVDGSNITTLNYYFNYCAYLTSIKMFNTNHITDVSFCFNNCSALTNVVMQDISNVTNIRRMFYNCSNLKTVSGIKTTGALTQVERCFFGCEKLEAVDVSNWNVSNISNFDNVFRNCKSLSNLDLNNWNVSNATRMEYIFDGCELLTNINIGNWDISKVEKLYFTFENCLALTSIDISNWDVRNIESMILTFCGCASLASIDVSNWRPIKCTNMQDMFKGCTSLSNDSLNGILKMCASATRMPTAYKTLKHLGLTSDQATTCQTLSNWDAFVAAGWSTGY